MFHEEFLQLMKSATGGRQVDGGLVLKFDGKVHAFGEVPVALLDPALLPAHLRVPETRPAMDEIVPVVRVYRADFFRLLLTQRNLGVGEAWIHGDFAMEQGSICHMLSFFLRNEIDQRISVSLKEKLKLLAMYARWRWSHNTNEDIPDHYDMSDDVMLPMLGRTGVYSCGYVLDESDSLDLLQANKMSLIFSKLRLKPGERVLDTGCGNGGLARASRSG